MFNGHGFESFTNRIVVNGDGETLYMFVYAKLSGLIDRNRQRSVLD